MSHKELLALGVFGRKSRIGDRIEMLLKRGRTFSPRASMGRVATSAVVLLGFLIAGSFAPRWIAFAQQAAPAVEPHLVFEVATIKPSQPGTRPIVTFRGHEAILNARPVREVIKFAYDIDSSQLIGGPPWINSDLYDIVGEPEMKTRPTMQQVQAMLQALLADRFKFTIHREKKEIPAYAIVVGKNGPKLTKSDPGSPNAPSFMFRGPGDLPAKHATMAEFAGAMQRAVLDRPVIDRTGLIGRFDFDLKWKPRGGLGDAAAVDDPNAPPDLITAVQEELGLKLESVKAPLEVLVIDHVERPSAN